MSFIAGYIAGLGEGKVSYTKQSYEKIFSEITTYHGWPLCDGKWLILLKITDGFGTDLKGTSRFGYHTYAVGNTIFSVRYSEEKYHSGYVCLYKNGGFIYANEINIGGMRDYYAYGTTSSGVTPYKTTEIITRFSRMENGGYSIRDLSYLGGLELTGTIHFSERTINRNHNTGEVTSDNVRDIRQSLDTYLYVSDFGFSDLSVDDRYNVYIEFGKDLKSLIG